MWDDINFSDHRVVERWLSFKRDVRVAFVARAALRLAPRLAGRLDLQGDAEAVRQHIAALERHIVLPVFRALAASWVAGQYPTARARAAAGTAASGARDAFFDAAGEAAIAHAGAVADAAAYAAYAAATADVVDAAAAAAAADIISDTTAAAIADARMINDGANVSRLAASPLWLAGFPDWADNAWQRLEAALLEANPDWRVWTDWYCARLEGTPAHEALDIARVLIADKIWIQGPRAVNAEIARLITRHGGAPDSPARCEAPREAPQREAADIPVPRAAPVEPVWRDDELPSPARSPAQGPSEAELAVFLVLRGLRDDLRKFAHGLFGETNSDKREQTFRWLRRLAIAGGVLAVLGQLVAKFPRTFE